MHQGFHSAKFFTIKSHILSILRSSSIQLTYVVSYVQATYRLITDNRTKRSWRAVFIHYPKWKNPTGDSRWNVTRRLKFLSLSSQG